MCVVVTTTKDPEEIVRSKKFRDIRPRPCSDFFWQDKCEKCGHCGLQKGPTFSWDDYLNAKCPRCGNVQDAVAADFHSNPIFCC